LKINYNWLIQLGISVIVLAIITFIALLIIAQMQSMYRKLPPPNSTEEWKSILNSNDTCKWYQIGCQKLACVIDCREINKNAGEFICVC
jgi:hypothetical protein